MRKIINISLPASMADFIEESVKKGKFASKSEYFRHLIRQQSEKELLKSVKKSHQQMKKGDKHLLKSFKDLRKL